MSPIVRPGRTGACATLHGTYLASVSFSMRLIVLLALLGCQAQPVRPAFEVTSVKPAPRGCPSSGSQGTVSLCTTLEAEIQIAYNLAAFGPHRGSGARRLKIVGGPAWVRTDPYEIKAKANGDAAPDQMYGPMMQVLLEDRFQLRMRREAREMPVYFLTVAKRGLKLKAAKEGSCVAPDANQPSDDPSKECGYGSALKMANASGGQNIAMDGRGETMAEFADLLSNLGSDRVVIDKTGLTGLFNIHLEFAMDAAPRAPGPGPSGTDAPWQSLFTAVQEQLGLRLSPGKGPVEVLVIDHVERPTEN